MSGYFDIKRITQCMDAERNRAERQAALADGAVSVLLHNGETTGVPYFIACRSAREPGRYQLSWLDSLMRPYGHTFFGSLRDCILSACGISPDKSPPHGSSDYRVIQTVELREGRAVTMDWTANSTAVVGFGHNQTSPSPP